MNCECNEDDFEEIAKIKEKISTHLDGKNLLNCMRTLQILLIDMAQCGVIKQNKFISEREVAYAIGKILTENLQDSMSIAPIIDKHYNLQENEK